ncbi:hypothetical protein EDD15DRAFT_2370436 [Pisolithus albus]|nr:hypothetical protein EDD15DRAFT_2370436 [Pisolithus albus]
MPHSGCRLLANDFRSRCTPYNILLRSQHILACQLPAPQTSGQPGQAPPSCIPASLGDVPSETTRPPAAVAGLIPDPLSLFCALTSNCPPSQLCRVLVVTSVPGSIPIPVRPYDRTEWPSSEASHLGDPMMVAGASSASTSATHDNDIEDHIVYQLVNGIPIPDHPGCQALCDLAADTIRAALVSYQSQIVIFNMLLSGGTPSSVRRGGRLV